jgi:5-methylcytosine-specific restriction protein A
MNARQYRKLKNRKKGECTWCGGEVPHGRRTWCGDAACVREFRLRHDWSYIRREVFTRDEGRCRLCGCEPQRITSLLCKIRCHSFHVWMVGRKFYESLGFPNDITRDWWEVDHILPRIEGGTDDLDNLRLVCVPCHKRETRRLAKRLARRPTGGAVAGGTGGTGTGATVGG